MDSADYTRIIREPDSGSVNFELFEYYKNQNLKRVGYVSAFEPINILEGYVREFYSNGKKKEVSNYVRNVKSGESTLFFQNGTIYQKLVYNIPPYKSLAFADNHTDFSNNE